MRVHEPSTGRLVGSDGFSLIELLVVVSFIAVLAAIAVPRFTGTRVRAIDAAMKSDLQNAMKVEEAWYADNGAYAAFSVADGSGTDTPPFDASAGVSVTATTVDEGIRIVASHAGSPASWCISTASGLVVEGTDC